MDRDKALRRTTAITGALVAASIAGTVTVGMVARASESTDTSPGTAPNTDTSPDATTNTDISPSTATTTEPPPVQSGEDDSGQATSGGS